MGGTAAASQTARPTDVPAGKFPGKRLPPRRDRPRLASFCSRSTDELRNSFLWSACALPQKAAIGPPTVKTDRALGRNKVYAVRQPEFIPNFRFRHRTRRI